MKIPIVNEKDEIIEYKDIDQRNPEEICRSSSLWVTDPEGNILLSQRGFSNRRSPGLWDAAAAGFVEEGETYESSIIKEAKEEIKLIELKPIIGPKFRQSTSHEYFRQWFLVVINHNYPFIKNDKEVADIKWFSRQELKKLFLEKPEMFTSSLKQYFETLE